MLKWKSLGIGLTVTIAKGWAWINCHWFYNDSIITLDIPTVGVEEKSFSFGMSAEEIADVEEVSR